MGVPCRPCASVPGAACWRVWWSAGGTRWTPPPPPTAARLATAAAQPVRQRADASAPSSNNKHPRDAMHLTGRFPSAALAAGRLSLSHPPQQHLLAEAKCARVMRAWRTACADAVVLQTQVRRTNSPPLSHRLLNNKWINLVRLTQAVHAEQRRRAAACARAWRKIASHAAWYIYTHITPPRDESTPTAPHCL